MNREEILAKAKSNTLNSMEVFISDWDCKVIVKEMSGKQYIDISLQATKKDVLDREKFLNYTIIATTFDIEDKKIFGIKDIGLLLSMGADSYSSLMTAITVLNNLNEDKDKEKNPL